MRVLQLIVHFGKVSLDFVWIAADARYRSGRPWMGDLYDRREVLLIVHIIIIRTVQRERKERTKKI